MSVLQYTQHRQSGLGVTPVQNIARLCAQKLPLLLKEQEVSLGEVNKVFTSEWLSENQVIVGTKCNSLLVLDLHTSQKFQIPLLKGAEYTEGDMRTGGIHSITVNPSRTLLVTGSENSSCPAVYQLPTFDPVCLGADCHTDWIFAIEWLDDEFFVTGSRDNSVALWSVSDMCRPLDYPGVVIPSRKRMKPIAHQSCDGGEKVRSIAFNNKTQEIAVLSTNGFLHMWDAQRFSQSFTTSLPYCRENVCLCISNDLSLYAVGSQSHISFLDSRTLKSVGSIYTKESGSGVRSISFNEDVATIGTGAGSVLFFDIRAGKYIEMECCSGETAALKTGTGFLRRDEIYNEYFSDQMYYPNAVYTHCYDFSKTRLFLGGGPLSSGLHGNYAAVWQ